MKKTALLIVCGTLLSGVQLSFAQEMPEMPPPEKEHEWLQKFVGEWETQTEIHIPNGETMNASGSESIRSIGGFWIVAQGESKNSAMEFSSLLTLGYDPPSQKYIGTWVDSMNSHLWEYEGTVDQTGKILTLLTEGPCPTKPGETMKFKEEIEFKSPDHRVFTSSYQDESGKWTTGVVSHSRRKK